MSAENSEACCPVMARLREYFPIVPFVFPLLFPILPAICLLVYLRRTIDGIERIERRLADILAAMRRLG